jgi:general secretion pathway protein D
MPNESEIDTTVEVNDSFLSSDEQLAKSDEETITLDDLEEGEFIRLNKLTDNQKRLKLEVDISKQFASQPQFQVSVNELPLNDFLHYVLGDLLDVSYLIEPTVKSNVTPVTLELKEKVSAQRLFQLTQKILNQNNIAMAESEAVFYVHPQAKKASKSSKAFGFGREESDVPNVSGDIIQYIPLKFGTNRGLKTTIEALVDARVILDSQQGLMVITAKRDLILRTLSLVQLLDSAGINNKAMALLSFSYIDSQTFIEKITELLAQEGILTKRDINNSATVKFIAIEHLGKVVVFASADEILTRVEYWTKQLDKPASGSEQSFFTYNPRYARAADLGDSLAPLISGSNTNANRRPTNTNATSANAGQNTPSSAPTNQVQSINGDNIRLVVDQRSNALIFYATGKFYQELLPIIKKLDVMPKQVMLEVVIAEVKLTGSFAKGVEFAIKSGASGGNQSNFSYNGQDGFGYSLVGLNGNLNINLNQKDGLINVLSRPTLLVRDGVSASINVGDDIPTVGSTTSDPINGERQTTTVQYRNTGINLTVTPTVNAQGTVIMNIEQNISNVSPDGAGAAGTPAIFERKIATEVVAGNGQTVLLGGLISENKSTSSNEIPLLGTLPIVGHLFRTDANSSDKTELVILVTPKIIDDSSDWFRIKQSFVQGLENIRLN